MLIFRKTFDPIARNAERVQRAYAALRHYVRDPDYDDETLDGLQDLLADLMHLAQSKDVEFREMLRLAEMHFTAEVNDEP